MHNIVKMLKPKIKENNLSSQRGKKYLLHTSSETMETRGQECWIGIGNRI